MSDWYQSATGWTLAHLPQIAVALIASLLAIVGGDITKAVQRKVRKWHFLARTGVFVLVAGLGFGGLVVWASPHLARAMTLLGRPLVVPAAVGAFCALGFYAERRRRL